MRRILRKSAAELLSILISGGALCESTPTIRASSPTREPSLRSKSILQFMPVSTELFESSIEHSEREDYSRDGWGDARQTVRIAMTGAISQSGAPQDMDVVPDPDLVHAAKEALARCIPY